MKTVSNVLPPYVVCQACHSHAIFVTRQGGGASTVVQCRRPGCLQAVKYKHPKPFSVPVTPNLGKAFQDVSNVIHALADAFSKDQTQLEGQQQEQ